MRRFLKQILTRLFCFCFKAAGKPAEWLRRVVAHAQLSAAIRSKLDVSVVVLGRPEVEGTGNIYFGKDLRLSPGLYFETQGSGEIRVEDKVVMSRGVHIVAFNKVSIGEGTLIGEYASIRDSDHNYKEQGKKLREAGFVQGPIIIGKNVWIGRGVCILKNVTIGDRAVIGANAVVTHDVPACAVVVGVPAGPLKSN